MIATFDVRSETNAVGDVLREGGDQATGQGRPGEGGRQVAGPCIAKR